MPLWALAQGITSLRIFAIPLVIYFELRADYPAVLITVAAAVLSDILDGAIARRSGITRLFGKMFDYAADFLFVLALVIYYSLDGHFIPCVWTTPLAAGVSYLVLCVRRKEFARTRLGRWNGTLALGGILVLAGIRVFYPALPPAVWQWVSVVLSAWFLAAAVENIAASRKNPNKKTLDNPAGYDKIE